MWGWLKLLNLDTIIVIVIIVITIYFLLTTKKKKHKFIGLNEDVDLNKILYKRSKKKKKKRYGKFEERCREIFSNIFRAKFKKIRPDWLKNPATGKNLELDGYNAHIKTPLGYGLAFEYDGTQHSKYTPHFHRNGPKEFVYQTKKDTWRDIKCQEKGVMLIRIPHTIVYQDLERYIRMKLQKNNVFIQG